MGQSLCTNFLTSLNIHKRNRFTDCLFKPNSKHLLNVRLQKGCDCGRKQVKKNLSHDVVTWDVQREQISTFQVAELIGSQSSMSFYSYPLIQSINIANRLEITEINQLSLTNRNQRNYCTSSSKKILAVELLAISHPFTNSQLQQINLKKRK